jgi:hypothetical protein
MDGARSALQVVKGAHLFGRGGASPRPALSHHFVARLSTALLIRRGPEPWCLWPVL